MVQQDNPVAGVHGPTAAAEEEKHACISEEHKPPPFHPYEYPPEHPHQHPQIEGDHGRVSLIESDPDDAIHPHDPGSPLKQGLSNLWLLAIMGGFLAIICVSSSRFTVPEPGVHW